ncbi:hypothetical protein F2Q69_00007068 [Brassica cretica]|uniref:Uncharacterized protein n=1 Tax=Brassica cretica TaxID=69181 RepID=A0A8S9PDT8_BRACR|nr:hypothetical protein F2Q69_00007068 [Brassica cretica]
MGSSKKEPADSRTIFDRHCSSPVDRHSSIDTVHLPSIDTVRLLSIDTIHLSLIDTGHPASIDTVHPNTVHPDTVHPVKNNTTCRVTEKIEVLILKVDENEMLRDEEGQDPFQGLPHQDPRNHIKELKDLVSRSQQNEVFEHHMLWGCIQLVQSTNVRISNQLRGH